MLNLALLYLSKSQRLNETNNWIEATLLLKNISITKELEMIYHHLL